MGEIADMMLDGTLCASCGDFLGEETSVPLYCKDCASAQKEAGNKMVGTGAGPGYYHMGPRKLVPVKVICPHCHKKVKRVGLQDHIKAIHSEKLACQNQQTHVPK